MNVKKICTHIYLWIKLATNKK